MYVAVAGAGRASARVERLAEEVGRLLAGAGAVVVTGGLGGVMEAASRGAAAAGGQVIAIVPGESREGATAHERPCQRAPAGRPFGGGAADGAGELAARHVAELAGSAARGALRVTPAAPVAATVLDALWRDGRVQPLLDRGLHRFAAFVSGQQEAIGDQVKAQTWRWLPRWVDRMLAAKISSGLAELLEAMRARPITHGVGS